MFRSLTRTHRLQRISLALEGTFRKLHVPIARTYAVSTNLRVIVYYLPGREAPVYRNQNSSLLENSLCNYSSVRWWDFCRARENVHAFDFVRVGSWYYRFHGIARNSHVSLYLYWSPLKFVKLFRLIKITGQWSISASNCQCIIT